MNVLWITNILLPEATALLTGKGDFKSSGGWMIGAAEALLKTREVTLSIAAPSSLVKELKVLRGIEITYYVIPIGKGNQRYNAEFEHYWKIVKEQAQPDVVHIHGTEMPHALAYLKACGNKHVVVSIQGLVSEYWKYKTTGISLKDIFRFITASDLFMKKSLLHGKYNLRARGKYEVEIIKRVDNIIGRTQWDKSHVWSINSKTKYFFCNETLRKEFSTGSWNYDSCNKHTIFCNQPTNSIKGFHQLLKALPLIIRQYPDSQVRLSGSKGLDTKTVKSKFLQTGYNRYLKYLVNKYNLDNHLTFLGPLTADEMKMEYLNTNVFISCSSIENSPNSVGEAQMLGTPCVSSYVGGVADMIEDGKTGYLYRFEETDLLAYIICGIFDKQNEISSISNMEIIAARKRHSPDINSQQLLNIYLQISRQ